MAQIVLLGDSIFDNGVYVPGGPDVIRQLRGMLPDGWQATLLAVDGAVTSSVAAQLNRLRAGATHLVVSVGGNDALGHCYLLGESVRSVGEAIGLLEQAQRAFASDYRAMLEGVLALGLPTALCTIYDTPPSATNHRIIRAALALFNDEISRAAFSAGVSLIDLRLICNEEGDYANPIEPSVQGGAKMVDAILRFARGEAQGRSWVVAGGC